MTNHPNRGRFVVLVNRTQRGSETWGLPPQCMDNEGRAITYSREEAHKVAANLRRNFPIYLGHRDTGGAYEVRPATKHTAKLANIDLPV